MASKPLITPEVFTGVGSWEEWIDHFECVADVNKWESNAEKLKWLKVRLTGRALKAFRQLPDAARMDYKEAKKALKKRFEPESRREYYVAELQTRRRRKGEDWASYGEELKSIAEKAYPDLEPNAREQFALTQFLASITNPQVAFSVRQRRPTTVDAAVTTAMEMELYMGPTASHVAHVNSARNDEHGLEVVAMASGQDATIAMLQKISERLDKLESKVESVIAKKKHSRESTVVCWRCREEGHIARDCSESKRQQQVGGAVNTVVTAQEDAAIITAVKSLEAPGLDCHIYGSVNEEKVSFMVDTGADVTLLSSKIWDQLKEKPELERFVTAQRIVGVQGSSLQVRGTAEVQIGLETERFNAKVVIVEKLTTQEAILGKDFLKQNSCVIDVGKGTLYLANRGITLPFRTSVDEWPAATCSVKQRQCHNRKKCDKGAGKRDLGERANFVGEDLGHENVDEKRGHVMPRRNKWPQRGAKTRSQQRRSAGGLGLT